MIKKLKIGIFLVALSLVAVAGVKNANAQALVYSADTNVTVNGSDYVIKSGSAATSVVINATTLVALIPAASTFTLESNAGFTLTNTDDAATPVVTAQTCASGISTVAYTGTGATVTFTPTTVKACGSSGGGGGGSSSSVPAAPVTPVTPAVPAVSCLPGQMFNTMTGQKCTTVTSAVVCSSGQIFSPTTGEKCDTFVSTPSSPYVPFYTPSTPSGAGYAFGNTLVKQGIKGGACKAWQMFLNDKANAGLAADGACGKLTMAAARAWQASMGLKADGLLGAMSRAKAMMQ
mgnify:CR=1 FL=1